ncbi:MAG: hypothetical protein AAGA30_17620, partial [Planctomycetota bacterium]
MKRNKNSRSAQKRRKSIRSSNRQQDGFSYELLEKRQVLTVGVGFDLIGAQSIDPNITSLTANTDGDVGPDHMVEIGEQTFTVYDRTGAVIESSSLNQFFIDAGATFIIDNDPNGENVIQPRVIYDHGSERWFAVASGDDSGVLAGNWIHIAISETSDPSGQWQQIQFVPEVDGLLVSSELSLGVDAAGVYLAARNVPRARLGDTSVS